MGVRLIAGDTETTSKSKYPMKKNGKSFGAWPFCKDNKLVLFGYNIDRVFVSAGEEAISNWAHNTALHPDVIVITHNGKFDLHYWRKAGEPWFRNYWSRYPFWDTQIAEYILSGQMTTMASLEDLELKYGLPTKVSEVKEHFENGGGADTVDENKLRKYLEGDVFGTLGVAEAQMAIASPLQKKLILQMGEAMKAAAEMEWNGFEVDILKLDALKEELDKEISKLETSLTQSLASWHEVPEEAININSTDFWRHHIYGDPYTFKWKTYDGYYKSGAKVGQPKPKLVTEKREMHREGTSKFPSTWAGMPFTKTPSGIYAVDEPVLARCSAVSILGCKEYLKYKSKSKLRNTYVLNILLNCAASHDNRLHHNLNLTIASTGRTSCSDPNMQNMPTEEKELRTCFVSRWGEDGRIVEIDFKALEMVGFATVNPDPTLVSDLNSGRDPHTETGKAVFSHAMSEVERRQVKGVNFGTIYGGGSKAVAENAGIDEALCKKIQKALKSRYKVGFDMAKSRVGMTVIEPVKTGRKYVVNGEYTKTMNYPVQGFSTGDLVPTVQGVLWAKLQESDTLRDSCLLINQEHDKFIFDMKLEVLDEGIRLARSTMEAAPEIMQSIYGVRMPCRTPVSVKVGLNMGSMEKYK